jgi:hypothetical protein
MTDFGIFLDVGFLNMSDIGYSKINHEKCAGHCLQINQRLAS